MRYTKAVRNMEGGRVLLIRSLGPLEIVECGRARAIGTPRIRQVLAILLARRGGLASVDQLIDELWPDHPPSNPRTLVHGCVSRLRRELGDAAPRLMTRKPGYVLQLGKDEWDVTLFEQSVRDARAARAQGDMHEATKLYAEAQRQWPGEPFADVPPAPTVSALATSLIELRLAALEEWFEARLSAGSDPELTADLSHHAIQHPLREGLVAQLMRALHRAGRQAEALSAFQATRELLQSELGVDPGERLRAAHQEVLRLPGAQKAVFRVPAQLPMTVPGFVGRQRELAVLDQAAGAAVVTGTAGVGKSALAIHWARLAAGQFPDGQLFVNLRGFDPHPSTVDPGEVLSAFLEALGHPADRVPPGMQARAALYRSVLAGRKVLVVLDNARDAEQVRPLLPGTPGSFALISSRDPLAGLVAVEGATAVPLDVLAEPEALDLLTGRLGTLTDAEAATRIARRCAGLPLALAVVAARLAIAPGLTMAALASTLEDDVLGTLNAHDPKADVRSVFSWSLRAVSEQAVHLFRLLGLHPGPEVGLAAVASLAGLSEAEAQPLLHELARAQLLTEQEPRRFSTHDLLRAYAKELSPSVGTAEARVALQRLLDHYVHTAHTAAGLLDPNRDPLRLMPMSPGVTVERLTTRDAAMVWFERERAALTALTEVSGFDGHVWRVAWCMSTFLRRRGYGRDWLTTQTRALEAARRSASADGQANSAFHLAMAHFRHGEPEEAAAALEVAVAQFTLLDDHNGLASTYHLRCLRSESAGDFKAALAYAQKGLHHYELAGHLAGQGRALGAMGWYEARLGQLESGREHCAAALKLAETSGDLMGQANCHDSLGLISYLGGALVSATESYLRSVELYRIIGDRYNMIEPLTGLGDTWRALGRADDAVRTWHEAFEMACELGHPATAGLTERLVGTGGARPSP
ncbi:transcriptional regulator [Catellatospora citrea]|uniref:AfsR/SARP family transcriptional regulator n=1 Tax=Catellatospora citrea TaxID=53366 RepID=UPI0033CF2B4C